MNRTKDIITVNDKRREIHGKTSMIGETSTGCCPSNTVKTTIFIIKIHTQISLTDFHVPLSLCFARVFIHGDIRVFGYH